MAEEMIKPARCEHLETSNIIFFCILLSCVVFADERGIKRKKELFTKMKTEHRMPLQIITVNNISVRNRPVLHCCNLRSAKIFFRLIDYFFCDREI